MNSRPEDSSQFLHRALTERRITYNQEDEMNIDVDQFRQPSVLEILKKKAVFISIMDN